MGRRRTPRRPSREGLGDRLSPDRSQIRKWAMVGKLNGVMLVVVAGIALGALPVAAQNRPTGPDQELVMKLRQLGQDQITMAKLGETRGGRASVTAFTAKVQRDQRTLDNG